MHELNINLMMREIHLVEVKYCEDEYCEDTWPGHQLEASKKQHEVLCKCLKAKKVILRTILLGVGGSICTSHTLNHLEELGLDTQKSHKTDSMSLSDMLILCSMHTKCQLPRS